MCVRVEKKEEIRKMPGGNGDSPDQHVAQPVQEPILNLKPPESLVVGVNMADVWKLWIQRYRWYEIGMQLRSRSKAVQVASFLSALGPEAAIIYNTFEWESAQEHDVDEL